MQNKEMNLHHLCVCIYLMQTIRLDPVILKHQLCIGTARDVKQQCSGRMHRDKMLLKCSCCSLEDQTTTERCITDLSNGKYRTVLELYSHCLKRQRWRNKTKLNKQTKQKNNTDLWHAVTQKMSLGLSIFVFLKGEK